ncbi:unnamed protein product [Darwinula stevensoni]|uniref:Amine oxidase n=1 Tax=Darwinula stevensoni TaxID=69355 RepID=A0A7R8X148_9CRUS|nr:unnamed protein product [Darwinula stevensoni]CAG0879830.1 unnamed protein product [Darwinula stevensoni]
MGEKVDVVIIGAGPSGCAAAHRLASIAPDIKIEILEARDRVGGRTMTIDLPCNRSGEVDQWDIGGQWVGASQTDVMQVIHDFHFETYPQPYKGTKFMQLGKSNKITTYSGIIPDMGGLWGALQMAFYLWKLERMCKKVSIADPFSSPVARELEGHTMASYSAKYLTNEAAYQSMDVAAKAVFGSNASSVSMLFFLAYANSSGGVSKLLESTPGSAQELPSGKTFEASYVISTLPPNLLLKVEFHPPLTKATRFVYENLPMGYYSKYIVVYDKAFWKDRGYSGEIVTNGGDGGGPLSVVFDATTCRGTPALVGFIAGSADVKYSQLSKDARKEAVVTALSKFLGDEALNPIHYEDKIWREDPYSGGCPSNHAQPGPLSNFKDVRLPFHRVHFAGTHTATEWNGYISGAIQAGKRAAVEVLHRFRPASISQELLKGTAYDPNPPMLPKGCHTCCVKPLLGCTLGILAVAIVIKIIYNSVGLA